VAGDRLQLSVRGPGRETFAEFGKPDAKKAGGVGVAVLGAGADWRGGGS